jgi:quercetin dioxygenase-like cupin family protein
MRSLLSTSIAIALLVLPSGARAADASKKPSGAAKATSVNASEIKWGEAPPSFPKGAELAVLHGDPGKKGAFTLRFKMPDGYKIAPHWHSQDENLTVVSGTFVLHMGDTMDAPSHKLEPGAFHFLPGKAHHAAEASGEVIVQVHGNGPFDIHYLNPADDPRKAKSASK